MVYYRKLGNEKIIHVGWCTHVRRMEKGSVGKFRTVAEAEAKGYRVCLCCEPEMRKYKMLPQRVAPKKEPSRAIPVSAFTPSYAEQLRMAL